jgi:hypothetical protein
MTEATDFLTICKPGMTLRTRGRTEARILQVDAVGGLIHGEIPMYGPAVWRIDGIYKDSPGGAAGPFDLMPPNPAAAAAPKQSVKLSEALDAEGRAFCCD